MLVGKTVALKVKLEVVEVRDERALSLGGEPLGRRICETALSFEYLLLDLVAIPIGQPLVGRAACLVAVFANSVPLAYRVLATPLLAVYGDPTPVSVPSPMLVQHHPAGAAEACSATLRVHQQRGSPPGSGAGIPASCAA